MHRIPQMQSGNWVCAVTTVFVLHYCYTLRSNKSHSYCSYEEQSGQVQPVPIPSGLPRARCRDFRRWRWRWTRRWRWTASSAIRYGTTILIEICLLIGNCNIVMLIDISCLLPKLQTSLSCWMNCWNSEYLSFAGIPRMFSEILPCLVGKYVWPIADWCLSATAKLVSGHNNVIGRKRVQLIQVISMSLMVPFSRTSSIASTGPCLQVWLLLC
jgi:hypothetical protein